MSHKKRTKKHTYRIVKLNSLFGRKLILHEYIYKCTHRVSIESFLSKHTRRLGITEQRRIRTKLIARPSLVSHDTRLHNAFFYFTFNAHVISENCEHAVLCSVHFLTVLRFVSVNDCVRDVARTHKSFVTKQYCAIQSIACFFF